MNCKAARKDALTPGASQLMDAEIIIVSGLPRSGTSLMMQMLASGGLKTVTDNVRTADTDNPRGYYELEKVKKIKDDASWLPETRGKAFKMVSQLLFDLPPNERYRIIFMERDLDEMLVSQEAMLQRRARAAGPRGDQASIRETPRAAARLAGRTTEHGSPLRQVLRPHQGARGTVAARQRVPERQGRAEGDGSRGGSRAVQKPQARGRLVLSSRLSPSLSSA